MTSKLLLRIASMLLLLHLIGHSFGHGNWKKDSDPAKMAVIRLMTGPKFPFMGVNRSMGDYFDGYGYIVSVMLLLMILLLWLASNHIGKSNVFARQAVILLGTLLLIMAIFEFVYFFPFAAIITLIAGLLSIGAWIISGRQVTIRS